MKKPERALLSLFGFIDKHSEHFAGDKDFSMRTVEREGELWRLRCSCGMSWVGDNLEGGIEMEK